MSIKILDEKTIARIAAGEVIERPASVVKELVENALDAGATQIAVEVQGGGVNLIKVTDNGNGIPENEVALAFQRHATSKLNSFSDLESIASLGFRGEALPSIAAVAGVEVLTGTGAGEAGAYLALEGGEITTQKRQARARGTTVTVRNLFQRVPARLKFLKSTATENGRIANAVSQYALACPEVAFSLTVDGKVTLRTTGKGRLLNTILDVYGTEIAGKMLPIIKPEEKWQSGVDNGIEVTGMVGAPELGRSSRNYISCFVNHRWVSSRLLAYAVEEAYHGLLMVGKHPVAVINISLPPPDVDVNIHPAKSEVKFRDDQAVFRAVQRAVRRALTAQMTVPGIAEAAPGMVGETQRQASWSFTAVGNRAESPVQESATPLTASLPLLRVVGQVLNAYIVAEGPDGVYLIDQHAAHERVRFDELNRQRAQQNVAVQGLLEPVTFEVSPQHDQVMQSCWEDLAGFGFTLEVFGERTYLVRAVPVMVAADDWKAMLRELLEELSGEARSRWEEKILASVACHGAVRSGQTLSPDEMRGLVRQLEKTANPHTCPHGRPTIIHLSAGQLEREFGRA